METKKKNENQNKLYIYKKTHQNRGSGCILFYDLPTNLNSKTRNLYWACYYDSPIHPHNNKACLALSNGLFIRKILKCRKLLIINLVHRSKWMFNLFHNLFMKLTMLTVCLFSTQLKTWTIVISTSFIYSESLWVGMANIKKFHQSLLIGFNSLSSHNIGLTLWTMVILKKDI
jgi:hypothetical protein